MKIRFILTYLFFLPFLLSADSVKIVLNSGEVLIGESLSANSEESYLIHSKILGELRIPRKKVQSYSVLKPKETEKPLVKTSAQVTEAQVSNRSLKIKEVKGDDASDLITDLYGKMKLLNAPNSWSGNLRIGMNLSFGDREYTHTYLRGKLKIQEKDSPHLFQLSGEYNYRETEQFNGSRYVSQDRYHMNFIYRWFFSESWFLQNASNYRTDKLKGIENELQNVLGYGFRKTFFESLEFLIGSGVGFQDRSLVGFADETTFIVNVFQELNWMPTKRIRVNQTLNFFQNPEKLDIYNYEFILGLNYRFTDLLGFEMRYFVDFDNGISESIKEDSRFQNALIFYF